MNPLSFPPDCHLSKTKKVVVPRDTKVEIGSSLNETLDTTQWWMRQGLVLRLRVLPSLRSEELHQPAQ